MVKIHRSYINELIPSGGVYHNYAHGFAYPQGICPYPPMRYPPALGESPSGNNSNKNWENVNGTWQYIGSISNGAGSGYEFNNDPFSLNWLDNHMPDPRFQQHDLDLGINMFPEVSDPFMFEWPLVYETSTPSSGASFVGKTILPMCYDPETLDRIDSTTVTLKKTTPEQSFNGLRLYTSSIYGFSFHAMRWGEAYNLCRDGGGGVGQSLLFAPKIRASLDKPPKKYTGFVPSINVNGYHGTYEDLEQDPYMPGLLYGKDKINFETIKVGRAFKNYEQRPIFGFDSQFYDGMDYLRAMFETKHQKYWPDISVERSMVSTIVDGMGSTPGPDMEAYPEDVPVVDLPWTDPCYVNGVVSQKNFQKTMRECVSCYREECHSLPCASTNVHDIYPGFIRNQYADVDGSSYCMYKRGAPTTYWGAGKPMEYPHSKHWYKHMDVPRRAVEWMGHYILLLREILVPMRKRGYREISEFIDAGEQTQLGYEAIATEGIEVTIGQINAMEGGEGIIPAGAVLFYYSNESPWQLGLEEGTSAFEGALKNHKASRIYAPIWYYDENDSQFKKVIVRLYDDYVAPMYRESTVSVVSMEGGSNPCFRDLATRGRDNDGMRDYFEVQALEEINNYRWHKALDQYEINSRGYHVANGANGKPVWYLGGPITLGIGGDNPTVAMRPKSFLYAPDCRAKGIAQYYGLPGEYVVPDFVLWTGLPGPRVEHFDEIDYRRNYQVTDERYTNLDKMCSEEELLPKVNNSRFINNKQDEVIESQPNANIITINTMRNVRNISMPMRFVKLSAHYDVPPFLEQDMNPNRQDYTRRVEEAIVSRMYRFGYTHSPVLCFMNQSHVLGGEGGGVIPPSLIEKRPGLDKHGREKIYNPSERPWWSKECLLGCGYETGTHTGKLLSQDMQYPVIGEGFTQTGTACFTIFDKYVPNDKQIVKAYLRLVPNTSNYIDSVRKQVGGYGSATYPGNYPFLNQVPWVFSRRTTNGFIAASPVEVYLMNGGFQDGYHGKSLMEVRNELITAYKNRGKGEGSPPVFDGVAAQKYLTLQCGVKVNGNDVGQTTIKSYNWYKQYLPIWKQGTFSMNNFGGTWTRLDYDEPQNSNFGHGFACGDHCGQWAANHRIFDVTGIVTGVFENERISSSFDLVTNKSTDTFVLNAVPSVSASASSGGSGASGSSSASGASGGDGLIPTSERISQHITNAPYLDAPTIGILPGGSGSPYVVPAGCISSFKISLKNEYLSDPKKSLFLQSIIPPLEENCAIEVEPEYVIRSIIVSGGSGAGSMSGMYSILLGGVNEHIGSIEYIAIPSASSSTTNILASDVHVIVKGPYTINKITVSGTPRIKDRHPITGYPIISRYRINYMPDVTQYHGYRFMVVPPHPQSSTVYGVQIRLSRDKFVFTQESLGVGEEIWEKMPLDINLTCIGYYNYYNPPYFNWENGWITGGTYAIDKSSGCIIMQSPNIFKYKRGTQNEWKFNDFTGQFDYADYYPPMHCMQLDGFEIAATYNTYVGSRADCEIQGKYLGPYYGVGADTINTIESGVQANYTMLEKIDQNSIERLPITINNHEATYGGGAKTSSFPLVMDGNNLSMISDCPRSTKINAPWSDTIHGTISIYADAFTEFSSGTVVAPAYVTTVSGNNVPNGPVRPNSIQVSLNAIKSEDNPNPDLIKKKQAAFNCELLLAVKDRYII